MGETTSITKVGRGAGWVLAALFAMNLLNYIDRYILSAVLGDVKLALTITDAQAGFLGTAFMVSYTIFSPIPGWLGDRWPRRYLLAAGVGTWSLATFASGLAGSYGHMLLARCVLGVGEATYATLAPALIGDLFRRDRRNMALTVFYIAIPLGAGLGLLIGGQFSGPDRWRHAFFVVGFPGLLVALAALALPEPKQGAAEEVDEETLRRYQARPLTREAYATLARNRSFVFVSLGMAMYTFALGGLIYWAPEYFIREQRITVEVKEPAGDAPLSEEQRAEAIKSAVKEGVNTRLGYIVGFTGLAGTALGGLVASQLARRWKGAYFTVSGATTLASVPFIAVALLSPSEVVVYLGLLVGLTLAFMQYGPTNTIIVNVTSPKTRAVAFAANIFVIHLLGDIPSPTLMGVVSEWTGSLFWGIALTIPAIAASGILYCLGMPHLAADQEAVLQNLRGES